MEYFYELKRGWGVNKMKRIITIIFCVIIFTFNAMPLAVFAEELPPSVVDDAEFLTPQQLSELTEAFDGLREKYNVDVSVVTVKGLEGKNIQDFADDYFDYNGYGCGANYDGIMLLVSKSPREYHFTTCGYGKYAFNDSGLIYIEAGVVERLKNNDYYGAFVSFEKDADKLLEAAKNGKPFKHSPKEKLMYLLAALIIPLVIAFIITFIQYRKMNDAVQRAAANEYAKGNVNIKTTRDIFLYSTLHKTPRPKDNGGSGSSTHTSSSGRSHGGRGGSY